MTDDLVFVDFETYYDAKDYSLRKLTPYEYCADPRFRVHAMALCQLDAMEPTVCVGEAQIHELLSRLDWNRVAFVAHNAHFDALVLDRLGYRPKYWLCTMQMAHARLLPELGSVSLEALAKHYGLPVDKSVIVNMSGRTLESLNNDELDIYIDYVRKDVSIAKQLFTKLLRTIQPRDEFILIDWTIKQAVYPRLLADVDLLDASVASAEEIFARACKDAGVDPGTLRSKAKFAALLEQLGVQVLTKPGKAGPTPAVAATDEFMIELREHDDPVIRALAEARLVASSNLARTRPAAFAAVARACGGRMPVPLHWHRARTGRWTGAAGLNMQNLPRGKSPLRRSLLAPSGHRLVVVDAAQIEARITAWLADCDWLVGAFREGRDVYAEFASRLYGVPITKQTHPRERQMGKLAVLSLGYGCGAAKFRWITRVQGGVDIDEEEAARIVQTYRSVAWQIPKFWHWADTLLRSMVLMDTLTVPAPNGQVLFRWNRPALRLPSERALVFPGLQFTVDDAGREQVAYLHMTKSKSAHLKNIWGGYLVENIVQALARDVLCAVHVPYAQNVVMQAHDELVALETEASAGALLEELLHRLRTPPAWLPGCPLDAEGVVVERYGDAK